MAWWPEKIPVYESNNPQTNLSIYKFYQNLAYKWKNWLSEANKYEEIIPTIKDENGEDVPNLLLENQTIGLNLLMYPNLRNHSSPIYIAEGLLMQQVLSTIPFSFETIEEIGGGEISGLTSWNIPSEYIIGIEGSEGNYTVKFRTVKLIKKLLRYNITKYEDFLGSDELKWGDIEPPYDVYDSTVIQEIKDSLYSNFLSNTTIFSYNEWNRLGSYFTAQNRSWVRNTLRIGDYIYFNLELAEDPPYSDLEAIDKEKKRKTAYPSYFPLAAYRYLGKFHLYERIDYDYELSEGDEKILTYIGQTTVNKYYHSWLWASAPSKAWTKDPSLDLGVYSGSYMRLDEEGNYDPEGRYQETPSSKENRFFRPIHDGRINVLKDIDTEASI